MDAETGSIEGGCPMKGDGGVRALLGRTNKDWWPEMLATEILNPNGPSNPMGADFDYAEALIQIAIVVISVSLVADLAWLCFFGGALGLVGALLTLNGFFLIVELPLLG